MTFFFRGESIEIVAAGPKHGDSLQTPIGLAPGVGIREALLRTPGRIRGFKNYR